MKNVSANHEDLISESVRISSGPPAVYQLITKKQTFGTLTRVTVGEKDERKPNKTILLVGETGSGKSTLINALFNYTMGVRFENELWFQIVEEDKKRWGESQTSDVIVYEILGFEGKTLPFSLTIIDTPGFGDTKGIKHDVIVSQRLYDLFRSDGGVHEINAVGLVMKASVNRLSDRLMYIFDAVMSLFGKDLEENIIALITHSDGKPSENVSKALESGKIKYSKDETNQPVFFLFNNNTERGTKEREITGSKYYWDFTEEEMCRLRNFLEKSKPQALITTVEVLNKRIRLTACIQNLQERIKLTELNQTEIKQIQDALKTYEGEMKKNENFTVEVDKVYKEKEDIDAGKWWFVFLKGAVTCNSCMENCHYPGCTMARKPSHCKVMSWGRCTVCTNKCPASDHVKEKWRYVTKTKKEKITLEDVKQKYEHNKAACQDKLGLLENLEQEMTQLTVEKSQLIDEAYQHVVRLEQIALNVDSVFTYVHLDYLMEKMKEKGDTEKIQVLEIVKTRMDKCSKEESSQLNKVVGLVKQNMPKI